MRRDADTNSAVVRLLGSGQLDLYYRLRNLEPGHYHIATLWGRQTQFSFAILNENLRVFFTNGRNNDQERSDKPYGPGLRAAPCGAKRLCRRPANSPLHAGAIERRLWGFMPLNRRKMRGEVVRVRQASVRRDLGERRRRFQHQLPGPSCPLVSFTGSAS